jgi:hypothetical protein
MAPRKVSTSQPAVPAWCWSVLVLSPHRGFCKLSTGGRLPGHASSKQRGCLKMGISQTGEWKFMDGKILWRDRGL